MAQTSALKRSLAVAGVLLLALVLGWWVLHTDGADGGVRASPLTAPTTRQSSAATLPESPASRPLALTPLAIDAQAPAAAPSAVSANDGLPSGSLTVRVRWSDRSVAAGVDLSVIDWHRPNATELMLRATTDAAGEAHFARVAAGSLLVQSDRADGVMVTLPPGEEQLVELVIAPGFAIVGRVVDEQGVGIADAVVSLSDSGGNYNLWHDLSRTDARGDFLLRDAGTWRFVCARAEGYSASDTFDVGAWADGDALEIVLRAPCGAVLATVSGPGGEPVAGAEFSLGGVEGGWPMQGKQTSRVRMGPQRRMQSADAGGAARFGSVPPGRCEFRVRAPGFAPFSMPLLVKASQDTLAQAVLSAGGTVAGRVTDERGQPVAEVWIESGGERDSPRMTAASDAQGRYRLVDLAGGPCTIHALSRDAGKASAEITVRPGEVVTWDPVVSTGHSVSGLVLGRRGEPIGGAWVLLYPADGANGQHEHSSFAVTAANGEFTALHVDWPVVNVEISPSPGGMPALVLERQERWTGQRVFQVPWSEGAGNVVIGRVVGMLLEPSDVLTVGLRRREAAGARGIKSVGPNGRFEVHNLPDGEFVLSVWLGYLQILERPVELIGGETVDLGELVILTGGLVVRPTFVGLSAVPALGDVSVQLHATDGLNRTYTLAADGAAWAGTGVIVGDYDLAIANRELGVVRQPVTIEAGAPQHLAVDLHPGAMVTISACGAAVKQAGEQGSLEVKASGGGFLGGQSGTQDSTGCIELTTRLAAGRYVVTIRADDTILATRDFDVPADAREQRVDIALP